MMRARRVFAWLLLPVTAYLLVCVLLYVQQRSLIYFPQATRHDGANMDFALQRDDIRLRGWVVNPGQRDALIYFGGNAESVELNQPDFEQHLPNRTVYLLPYRGYGANDGEPTERALVDDALALHDEVRRRHSGGRIAVMGRSLGSGVASQVAAQRPVDALVLVTPFASLAAVAQQHYRWLPVRWLLRDRYASDRHLADYTGRWLVLRAGRDAVVPPARSSALLDAAQHRPQVEEFPDAGHDDISADPRYWQSIARFLVRTDEPRAAPP